MLIENVYLNRDNLIDLILKAKVPPSTDYVALDLSSVTAMKIRELHNGAFEIDSDTYASAFDWITGPDTGRLTLDLAAAMAAENVNAGDYECYLIVIDPTYTDGLVWDEIQLNVRDA